jgi:hypothetical protein
LLIFLIVKHTLLAFDWSVNCVDTGHTLRTRFAAGLTSFILIVSSSTVFARGLLGQSLILANWALDWGLSETGAHVADWAIVASCLSCLQLVGAILAGGAVGFVLLICVHTRSTFFGFLVLEGAVTSHGALSTGHISGFGPGSALAVSVVSGGLTGRSSLTGRALGRASQRVEPSSRRACFTRNRSYLC